MATVDEMTPPDSELLASIREGDARALEELLARYEPQVYRFGLRMCGNEEDARDVLQETLLAAFRGAREFRGEARLSTWLFQVARSFCSKARRRGADEPVRHEPLQGVEASAVADRGEPPDARAHASEVGRALQEALSSLPEASREVVVLRDVEGLSAEEAASVLGIEVPALKSRLHRARVELREKLAFLLEPEEGEPVPCPELAQELAAYASAEIDQATCAAIEAHLARCASCGRACDRLQSSVSLCSALPGGAVPARVQAEVRGALQAALRATA